MGLPDVNFPSNPLKRDVFPDQNGATLILANIKKEGADVLSLIRVMWKWIKSVCATRGAAKIEEGTQRMTMRKWEEMI